MKAGSDKRKNKIFVRGSMALEMALTLPLLLILVFVFYGHVREIDQSLSARHALDQVANEIELLYPLSDLIAFETELNETAIAKILDELGLKDYVLDLSGDVVASLLSGPVLNQRYDYWLEQTCAARGQTVPQGERRFFVDYVSEKNLIYLGLSYQRTSLLAEGEEYIKSSIPLWSRGKYNFVNNDPEGDEEEIDGIWSMSNFQRGLEFRQMYGANLPATYPCIARWQAGTAVSIKSMDFTAPSWQTQSTTQRRVYSYIDELSVFEGGRSDVGPQIGEIQRRQLILIIPHNHADWFDTSVINEWKSYAGTLGVELEISRYGNSSRYDTGEAPEL